MLVAPHVGFSEVQGEFDQLIFFDLPPDVVVTEPNIRVFGDGLVSVGFLLEGPRSSLEDMLGVDLSVMPDETIGVGFSFESILEEG